MHAMRAMLQVESVKQMRHAEELRMTAVCGKEPFGAKGESEENTFARYTPSGDLSLTITNPDLHGTFKPGQKFYVDFHEVTT